MARDLARSIRRRVRMVLGALAIATVLAGCGGFGDDPARLRQQAEAALARWADAVAEAGGPSPVVLVGERTGQVGDWELAVGDNNKPALMAGMVEAGADLSAEAPPDGEVSWPDGTTASVPLLSAQEAVAAIQASSSGPCGECTSLTITEAALTAGSIQTSRGFASGPMWEFTVKGTAVLVTHVAIAHPIAITPPPWDPTDPPIGLSIDSAQGTAGSRQLTVEFIGAPAPGDQPCGEDYTGDAVESDLAVVVIVTRHPHLQVGACSAVGARRTAVVELAAPLGDRAVLEVQQGLPVSVTLTP